MLKGRPWAVRYGHPVPWDTTFEALTVPALLDRAAAKTPDARCIDFLGRGYSYAEVARMADRAAEGFRKLGVRRGVKVGLFLPNCPHYVAAYYGAMKAGGTVVNFSPLYNADELADQVEDSGTEIMVCLDVAQLYPTIAEVLERTAIRRLVVGSLTEVLPRGKAMLYRLFKAKERSKVAADDRHIRFAALLDNGGLKDPPAIDPEDIALLQYTGGTTGTPKGAVLTHANLTANAQQVNAVDPRAGGGDDRILGALPLFHVFANTCVLNRTVLGGGEMVLLPKFDAGQALKAIARRKVTSVPGVPTMYRVLLDHPEIGRYDLSSIRVCVSGGAPMPAELKQRFEAATGAVVVEGYGLTESAGVVATNPYEGMNKAGSIGLPLPGTDVRIAGEIHNFDTDRGRREVGEIQVAGPQVMREYWDKSLETDNVFDEDYLRTGDIGYIDDDGYIFIVDRLKDMIAVGGFKVFPSRLETLLYSHPAVKEALVIGVPDLKLGERPKAFVTLQDGESVTAEELCGWLNARVGKHERAIAVEVRASLPKTMIGKLSKKELVAEERAKAAA